MIKIIEKIDNYIYLEVMETITKEDVNSIEVIIDEMVKNYKKIKYLIVLKDVKGYTFEGFLADMSFYIKHYDSFDYVAVVGDKNYEEKIVNMFNKMTPGKAKYFDKSELQQAKEWLR